MNPTTYARSECLPPGESLQKVCEKHEKTLTKLGITRNQIADVLELAVELAKCNYSMIHTQGSFTLDGQLYHVELQEYMGKQEWPFGGFPPKVHAVVHVINDSTKKTYYYGGGLPEMIRTNGFFEGNVLILSEHHYGRIGIRSFRVDPIECVEFFGITPVSDYREQMQKAKDTKMTYYVSTSNFLRYNNGSVELQHSV